MHLTKIIKSYQKKEGLKMKESINYYNRKPIINKDKKSFNQQNKVRKKNNHKMREKTRKGQLMNFQFLFRIKKIKIQSKNKNKTK